MARVKAEMSFTCVVCTTLIKKDTWIAVCYKCNIQTCRTCFSDWAKKYKKWACCNCKAPTSVSNLVANMGADAVSTFKKRAQKQAALPVLMPF